MAKWQYTVFQFFKREKEMYASNVLNLQRLSFKIRSNPARKHSTHLHRKLEIIGSFHAANSCRVPLELILTLNCL